MYLRPTSLIVLLALSLIAGPSMAKSSLAMAWFNQTQNELTEVDTTLSTLNQRISELEQKHNAAQTSDKLCLAIDCSEVERLAAEALLALEAANGMVVMNW